MKTFIIILFSVFIIAITSCSNGDRSFDELSILENPEKYLEEMPATEYDESSKTEYATALSQENGSVGGTTEITESDPAEDIASVKIPDKIIKNASLVVEVDNYEESIKKIKEDVKKWEGYSSSENEVGYGHMISNVLTIRVESKNFENLLNDMTTGIKKVESKSITAVDVSEEFVDIMARLKTKREVENRYIELLKKAYTVQDILYVEDKIRVIREEIEAKEGRLKYLQDRVSFSTITIEIKQYYETDKNEPGFGEDMGDAFGGGWSGFLMLLVGLTYLWPLWLIVGGGLFILFRILRRNKRRRNQKQ
jgi:hypothetical protein